ncbi:MAG: hypothetical protein OEQ53_05220 [Saprospiraceae bacterium]|nr:hypothetical protein [Saprospiraceae bacterium]
MYRIIMGLFFVLALGLVASAQSKELEKKEDQKEKILDADWKEAMKDVEHAIENLQIPDLEVEKIIHELEEVMPTKVEWDHLKTGLKETVKELKKIDLSEIEEALKELEGVFDQIIESRLERGEK